MFTQDITLGTKTYSLRVQRPTSSVRGDASQPVNEPNLLTIGHETAKSGRVSTVVYLDDIKLVQVGSSPAVSDTVRAMIKLQYNPISGRTTTANDVKAALAALVEFASVASNVDKLLNQES